jgi:hypothetical protein
VVPPEPDRYVPAAHAVQFPVVRAFTVPGAQGVAAALW